MTRTVMVIVAGCVALVITVALHLLEQHAMSPAPSTPPAELAGPSPNTDGKRDKLPIEQPALRPEIDASLLGDPLRQAYAPDSPPIEPGEPIAGPIPMPRARSGARPAVQKNYTLLSDVQIAAIKTRLRLTNAQEALWPDVEKALRTLARNMHDRRQAMPGAAVDAESADIEQLKAAAQPLIAKLSDEQKREVRALARLIGLDAVASQI